MWITEPFVVNRISDPVHKLLRSTPQGNTNMSTISIIGTGGIAAAIGGLAASAGHRVEVISRDAAKERTLAAQVRLTPSKEQ